MSNCALCNSKFIKKVHNALYCSNNCKAVAKKNKTKEWITNNKNHLQLYNSQYYLKNKEYKIKRDREYKRQKMKTDIHYKLRQNLRKRLNCALKNNQKSGSAIRDLGCSIEELKKYLESKFQEGMTWKNWGRGKDCWHIDHIIPLSSFNLTDKNEFCKACHYSNLQPLWEKDNLNKSNRLDLTY